ncbi:MAG: alpha/beta fold hydrolase, partial [Actinobacteria bacterium]|nr:alpha/beta fold hydrolase [Actinomycetota bacterium]
MWDGLAPALAERFRLIRIETRGHGGSPTPPATGPVTLADLAADVLAVLDELGVNRAHVAGLSLGGLTALWLAAHAPHRVGRIAVLCAAIDQPRQKWQDRAAAVGVFLQLPPFAREALLLQPHRLLRRQNLLQPRLLADIDVGGERQEVEAPCRRGERPAEQ